MPWKETLKSRNKLAKQPMEKPLQSITCPPKSARATENDPEEWPPPSRLEKRKTIKTGEEAPG